MVTTPHKSTPPDDLAHSSSIATGASLRPDLPTMYDLPSEDLEEPGLPDEYHDLQPQLLSRTLQLADYSRQQYFTAADLNLYYDPTHPLWYKRADWFLAIAVPRLYNQRELRRSYVTWQEPRSPYIVIEFLSVGTEGDDLGRFHSPVIESGSEALESQEKTSQETQAETPEQPPNKLAVYEEYLQVPHYLVYNRQSAHLRYFQLIEEQYQEQTLNASNPLVWLDDLKIGLGIWQGDFDDASVSWLRWCDRHGNWLLTDTEQEQFARELAEQQAEQERLAKEQIQNQLLQAAQNLLATGMTMEQVTTMLNLSSEQIQRLNKHPS